MVEDQPRSSPVDKANERFVVLLMQEAHCGIDTKAAQAADDRVFRSQSTRRIAPAISARPPVLCDTTPKAYGGSTTDCF